MLKSLSFENFKKKSAENEFIPVYQEFLADLETPVSVLNKFRDQEDLFLLESVEGAERWARYSFIGLNPSKVLRSFSDRVEIYNVGGTTTILPNADGLVELEKMVAAQKIKTSDELPPMIGGAIGFISYDAISTIEPSVKAPHNDEVPLLCFMLTQEMIIFDNNRHTVIISKIIKPSDFPSLEEAYQTAQNKITKIHKKLSIPTPNIVSQKSNSCQPFISEMTPEQFEQKVIRAKEAISQGECIQIVLSQKFTTTQETEPILLYRALRLINPSPYTFFMKFGEHCLIGSSPEELVKLTNRAASVCPIAGTRPRGETEQIDRANANELLENEKERAEHMMLVDLGRNDLGRVSTIGSVQVKDFMTVERYSHVMHLVSHIESELATQYNAFDLFKATFPAGTLSGAPKIRAMQLIAELEDSPRGIYGGAAGYISNDGNMNFAIVIRTMLLDGKNITMRAGAGIVADSVPTEEYQETINKSQAVFKAVELAHIIGKQEAESCNDELPQGGC